MIENVAFSVALRMARESVGLSQSRLAARAGYDHSYVGRLESDSRSPTRDAVLNMAAAMGMSDIERDLLLASADCMPVKISSLLVSEPVLSDAYAFFSNPAIPRDVCDDVRAAIRVALRQGERAAQSTKYREVARQDWQEAVADD